MSSQDDFFRGKRTWSRIKDRVLADYMPPYLAKVNRLGRNILLVDGYAGPGLFDDGTEGSPLIMCQQAEQRARGNYRAVFVNVNKEHHSQLTSVLAARGYLHAAQPIKGDARQLLASLPQDLGNQTLFLYLDPFGLVGCEFELLRPFFARDPRLSTEVVFLMHMPVVHRLTMTQQQRQGRRGHPLAEGFYRRLTAIFGGDYWKPILWNPQGTPEDHERELIAKYASHIRTFLPYVNYCPVREGPAARIKYFIVFASRHEDAMLLMNDAMAKAYHDHMHRQRYADTLWEKYDWRDLRDLNDLNNDLDEIVVNAAGRWPGLTRAQLWTRIVDEHFMEYTESEYIKTLKGLADKKTIAYPPDPRTNRRNGNSRLSLLAPAIK